MDDQDENDLYGDLSGHTLELEGASIDEEEQRILAAAASSNSTGDTPTVGDSKRLSFNSSSTSSPSSSSSCTKCIDTTQQLVTAQCEIAQLKTQLAQVQSKLNITVRQNGVLLRNLSLLFSTAQAQLKRSAPAASSSSTASSDLKEQGDVSEQPVKKQRVG